MQHVRPELNKLCGPRPKENLCQPGGKKHNSAHNLKTNLDEGYSRDRESDDQPETSKTPPQTKDRRPHSKQRSNRTTVVHRAHNNNCNSNLVPI